MAKNNVKKVSQEDTNKVAEKMYDNSDYEASDLIDMGTAITHEQASDDYTEGTIDGEIDSVNENGGLKSDKGKEIPREGF
ncbi:YozQ family protein [Aquibacillus rhizosphaerae]|uniref:YozQ family protein n=1 Tax=Aquibacillus rhizosphaerae TaxID=3051431 RepID=A0ABT7LB83_9BACI|nr:YozQ family protein [Aquibacillus sp. LR5S19]MDL4842674.1 YozQ family protein [Aquibacillus sp. LR5S19]